MSSSESRAVAVGTATAMLLALTALTGCSAGRSPQAFCGVYWDQKHAYLAKYDALDKQSTSVGQKDPLGGMLIGLSSSLQAVGDMVVMFDKLDAAAPDDIEPDVAAIRDSLKSQVSSAGDAVNNPLGSLVGGLVTGLTTMGSWDRVSKYVVANCGEKG